MRVVVADASALVEYLLRTDRAAAVEAVVRGETTSLHVPALCDIEVAAAIRRALLRRLLTAERAVAALGDYLDLPLSRRGHEALLDRILDLRANFSAYDATYLALAEELGAELLTADDRLRRAAQRLTSLEFLP